MSPPLTRSLLLLAASTVALIGCGHTSTSADPTKTARAAQQGAAYPLAWVGPSLAGLPLTDVTRDRRSVTLIYGTCKAVGESGCTPPLEIQTASICDRNALLLDIRPIRRFTARGVQILDYGEDRFELATATTDVVISARPALASKAIGALRPLDDPRHAQLAAPRYPRYYLGQLRRVHDTYTRTHSLRAIRAALGISKSAARFELGLARQLGADRLERGGRNAPSLQDVKHALQPDAAPQTRRTTCALESAR
jgi:hypothetical protein